MNTDDELFWAKVEKTETCWNWQGATDKRTNYGRVQRAGKTLYAHRLAYELIVGPVPEGMVLDHICRTRSCVNPNHIHVVTRKQNGEHLALSRANTSGVRGVSWHKPSEKWMGSVRHNYRLYNVGYFATIAEAEAAVIAKRNELFTNNLQDRSAA